jgi:hypothetical protein
VVGAYALAAHGNPRATGDIDLLVRPTAGNAARVWQAITAFGAPRSGVEDADFAVEDTIFQIGVAPRRIDLLTSITGVTFDQAWNARKAMRVGDLSFYVLGREELITYKRAAGRPKDLADAAWLENTDWK